MERHGHKAVGWCEKDKFAQKSYKAIHNIEGEWFADDITTVRPGELPEAECYTAGFPCQSFSIAGHRGGFEDTRGTLFFEIMRLARERKPKCLFLENVKGLLSHDGGKTFATILNTLWESGYMWEYQVLNSKNFGVPQNRERVFIVGHLRKKSRPKVFPIRRKNKGTLKEHTKGMSQGYRVYDTKGIACTQAREAGGLGANTGLYKVGNIYPSGGQNGNIYSSNGLAPFLKSGQGVKGNGIGSCNSPKIVEGLNTTDEGDSYCIDYNYSKGISPKDINSGRRTQIKVKACLTPERINKRQNGRRFKENGEPMFTLTGQDIHGIKQNMRIRKLTPKECWRLQGFPDWAFKKASEINSDTQLYRQAGNAVTVNVIEEIAKRLGADNDQR